jgi:hypothetical protein
VIRANLNMVTDEVLSESSAFITSHAACCTAPQGVAATPKPFGAKSARVVKVALHSSGPTWVSDPQKP